MRLPFMLTALCAVAVPTAALAATGDTEREILADCGQSELAAPAVDSCLERARILDETSPSPQIESLIAKLEVGTKATPQDLRATSPATGESRGAEGTTGLSQAPSTLRPLESGAAVALAPGQTENAAADDQAMDDDDAPPVADASPRAGGSSDQGGPAEDNGDNDDDEPPVDDAPHI